MASENQQPQDNAPDNQPEAEARGRNCQHKFKKVPGGKKCRKCPAFIPNVN